MLKCVFVPVRMIDEKHQLMNCGTQLIMGSYHLWLNQVGPVVPIPHRTAMLVFM